jgi:hypothetical protein
MWDSPGMSSLSLAVLATSVLAVGAAVPAGQRANSQQTPSQAHLKRFLMRDGEVPGYRRSGRATTLSGVDAVVRDDPGLTEADAERLRDEGFISSTAQQTRSRRTVGVTSVQLFATAEGAGRDSAHETSRAVIANRFRGAKITHFTIAGVPGAHAYKVKMRRQDPLMNLLWVQGRCVLILGSQGTGPLLGQLSEGARAIQRRTAGRCP